MFVVGEAKVCVVSIAVRVFRRDGRERDRRRSGQGGSENSVN